MKHELSKTDEGKPEVSDAVRPVEGEPDLPPEYCHYRDEGCELAGSCLNCPFARCVYEEPGGKLRLAKYLRAKEMARLFSEGKGLREIASKFGVSERTVRRALKQVPVDTNQVGQGLGEGRDSVKERVEQ